MLALAQYQKMKKRVRVAIDGYDKTIKDYIRLVMEETHRKGREAMEKEMTGEKLAKMREENYRELQDLMHQLSLQENLSHKSMMVINEEMDALRAILEEKRKQLAEKEVETEEEDTEDWGGYEDWEEELEKEEEEEMVAELYDKKDWEYKDGWYYPPGYEEDEEEEEFDSDEFFQEVYEDALQHMDSVVHHPKHYNQYGDLEVIDIITEATKNMQGDKGYVFGNILKYLLRAPFKGKFEEDVAKANWYWKYYEGMAKSFISVGDEGKRTTQESEDYR